jgi:integrase
MASSAGARPKIPTKIPQPVPAGRRRTSAAAGGKRAAAGSAAVVTGVPRPCTRAQGRVVMETAEGITVYPARSPGDRWRAVWYENGTRQQCQAASEERLVAKLEKVAERLTTDAPNLLRPAADLIAWYLSPERHPAGQAWSRKHTHTQRRLCQRFLLPVLGDLPCQDILVADMQRALNAVSTAGEGARLRRCISALVSAGLAAGWLANARLREVHWQASGREVPGPKVTAAGESAVYVDPDEIPGPADVAKLGQAMAVLRDRCELMANFAAYTGLRWGELAALTAGQIDVAARMVRVDRKVVEVGGALYVEAPKNRKWRRTIYPRLTPEGYPLGELVAARVSEVAGEQAVGRNPLGRMFPSPGGRYWRSSNFRRRVLQAAYLATGWRDANGEGRWTWHSLRHVFCTTALNIWRLDAPDVSRLAGHANVRITLEMYVGSTSGAIERALAATR